MRSSVLRYLICPLCEGGFAIGGDHQGEVVDGELCCTRCRTRFPIVQGVPFLLGSASDPDLPTSRLYSDIWKASTRRGGDEPRERRVRGGYRAPAANHFELLRMASATDVVAPGVGIDAGCGNGSTAIALARSHPELHVLGVDLSEGPLTQASVVRGLPNVDLIRGDLMALPLARDVFDFVYSFGVIHHTSDPRRAFAQLVARLRPGGRITIFVYKDFTDLPVKRFLLGHVNRLRRVSTRLSPATLRRLSRAAAPIVLVCLSIPARALRSVGLGRWARHIPYGTFSGVASIASSLQDRFGAPFEFRFSLADLRRWADEERLEEVRVVDCLPWGFAGLVLTGLRPSSGA